MKTGKNVAASYTARIAGVILLMQLVVSAVAGDYIPKAVDINKADTTLFMALPGIGSKLANRIVKYREKLHGFHTIEQLAETFGLADTTFTKIRKWLVVDTTLIEKININKAGIDDLKTPYISYNLANAIYQYRIQHGEYKSLSELRKIMLVDEVLFNKIIPYLTIG